MNDPFNAPEPLLHAVASDAADLPRQAAAEARRYFDRRCRQRRLSTAAVLAATIGFASWAAWQHPAGGTARSGARDGILAPAASPLAEFVKVQSRREATIDPLPIPDGLSREQRELLAAAQGFPLLLVKDATGKVTRIDVIER
jgi:hypothetical protein